MHHVHRLVDSDGSDTAARARHSVTCRKSTPNMSTPNMTIPAKRHAGRRLGRLLGRAGSCTRLSGAIQDNASIDRCMPRVDSQHVDAQHDAIILLVWLGVCLGVDLNDVESVRHAPGGVPRGVLETSGVVVRVMVIHARSRQGEPRRRGRPTPCARKHVGPYATGESLDDVTIAKKGSTSSARRSCRSATRTKRTP